MAWRDPVCIDLDQPKLEGFRKFLSAWLFHWGGKNFLVDPGPLSTIPVVLDELSRRRVDRLDYILLTHIHIDHGGGVGELIKAFPETFVICHPAGIPHMVDPGKLWRGSRNILGKVAEFYGPILPIPEDRIGFQEDVGGTGLRAFLAPGHAAHHVCYLAGDLLFCGEAAGVRCPLADGGIYMRPATPPRFVLDIAIGSLDRMLALRPRRVVFAHYGLVEPACEYLKVGRGQLPLWVRGVAATAGVDPSRREEAFFEWLLARDEYYRNITRLDRDIQARERLFLKNTLQGMREYVERFSPFGLQAGE